MIDEAQARAERDDRFRSLRGLGILDTAPEPAWDALVRAAAAIAGTPISVLDLLDSDRLWAKAQFGIDLPETAAEGSFCSLTVRCLDEPLIVHDAAVDHRFAAHPDVVGPLGLRFYAGFPVRDEDGVALGALCVADTEPRHLTDEQTSCIRALVITAEELIRLRRAMFHLDESRQRAALFERGFEASAVGMQVLSTDGVFLRVNQAFADMVGRSVAELVGMHWWDIVVADDGVRDLEMERQLDSGELGRNTTISRYARPDGRIAWGSVSVVPVMDDGNSEGVHYSQVTDITGAIDARDRAVALAQAVALSEQRLDALVGPAPDPVLRIGVNFTLEALNPAGARALGVLEHDLLGGPFMELPLSPHVRDAIRDRVATTLKAGTGSVIERLWFQPVGAEGGWFRVRILPVLSVHGDPIAVYVVLTDVTDAVETEDRLAAQALIDPLTGVSNRAALFGRLEAALSRLSRGESYGIAIAAIDLDHFKALNDTHGHQVGDLALQAVSDTLVKLVRAHDTVARLGGDEFVVLFDDVDEQTVRESLAPRLAAELRSLPVWTNAGTVSISGSIGVSWAGSVLEAQELLLRADRALLEAKEYGRSGLVILTDENRVDGPFGSHSMLLLDLTAALDRNQFRLAYQPIVDTQRTVVAYEALLRWDHPVHGMLPPAVFMPALFETGIISIVGEWVLATAATDLAERWLTLGDRVERFHVNLSPRETTNPRLPALLRELLSQHGMPGELLIVELTEQAFSRSVVSTSMLSELATMGIPLALDDFGTGASSLAHLRYHNLHALKIDRSFVTNLVGDEGDRAILSGTIKIARDLGLDVIAEGVETEDQHEWLAAHGCTHFQGWLHGRPVPLPALN